MIAEIISMISLIDLQNIEKRLDDFDKLKFLSLKQKRKLFFWLNKERKCRLKYRPSNGIHSLPPELILQISEYTHELIFTSNYFRTMILLNKKIIVNYNLIHVRPKNYYFDEHKWNIGVITFVYTLDNTQVEKVLKGNIYPHVSLLREVQSYKILNNYK